MIGSSVGTAQEMKDLLDMALSGDVAPMVQVFEFERVDDILQKLAKSQIAGRVVLTFPR